MKKLMFMLLAWDGDDGDADADAGATWAQLCDYIYITSVKINLHG